MKSRFISCVGYLLLIFSFCLFLYILFFTYRLSFCFFFKSFLLEDQGILAYSSLIVIWLLFSIILFRFIFYWWDSDSYRIWVMFFFSVVVLCNIVIFLSVDLYIILLSILLISFFSIFVIFSGGSLFEYNVSVFSFKLFGDVFILLFLSKSIIVWSGFTFLLNFLSSIFGNGFELCLLISMVTYSLAGILGFWIIMVLKGPGFVSLILHSVGLIMIGVVLYIKLYYMGVFVIVETFFEIKDVGKLLSCFFIVSGLCFFSGYFIYYIFTKKSSFAFFSAGSVCFSFVLLFHSIILGVQSFIVFSLFKVFILERIILWSDKLKDIGEKIGFVNFKVFIITVIFALLSFGFIIYIFHVYINVFIEVWDLYIEVEEKKKDEGEKSKLGKVELYFFYAWAVGKVVEGCGFMVRSVFTFMYFMKYIIIFVSAFFKDSSGKSPDFVCWFLFIKFFVFEFPIRKFIFIILGTVLFLTLCGLLLWLPPDFFVYRIIDYVGLLSFLVVGFGVFKFCFPFLIFSFSYVLVFIKGSSFLLWWKGRSKNIIVWFYKKNLFVRKGGELFKDRYLFLIRSSRKGFIKSNGKSVFIFLMILFLIFILL